MLNTFAKKRHSGCITLVIERARNGAWFPKGTTLKITVENKDLILYDYI